MDQWLMEKLEQMQRAGHGLCVDKGKVVSVPAEADDFFTSSELAELIAEIEANR